MKFGLKTNNEIVQDKYPNKKQAHKGIAVNQYSQGI